MLNTFTQSTVIGIVRGYNWSSWPSKMKTYFTLLNSDRMISADRGRLTAVMSEHISEPSTSALLCHCHLFVFHREIQSHFPLTNKCVMLYLQAEENEVFEIALLWYFTQRSCYLGFCFHFMEMQLAAFSPLPAFQNFLCEDLAAPQSSLKTSVGARQVPPEYEMHLLCYTSVVQVSIP